MAGTLPTVRGGVQALCPVTRRVEFLTDVAINLNGTEQRAKRRPALTRFVLPYTRISAAETAAMRTFFEAQKGTWDSTWSFTLGATAYAHLTFEDDTFTMREDPSWPGCYAFTLRARQTMNPGMAAGAAGAAFPTLSRGNTAMLPYQQMRRFAVTVNDNPMGPRYACAWVGLTGFPAGALHAWELAYSVLTDADAATLEAHFRNQWGRWARFSLTDPDDAAVYPKCRYDSDSLEIVNNGPNQNSLTLKILETY